MALVPSDRLTDWTPGTKVGVPGGIAQYLPGGSNQRTTLIDVTGSPYNADKTGATDASSAINSAINSATTGQVVYLPAGTYKLTAALAIGQGKSITVRGVGATTILDCRAGNAFLNGTQSDYNYGWPTSGNVIAAGSLNQNSNVITIADTSAFSVGQLVRIAWKNQWDNTSIQAGAIPVVDDFSYDYVRAQISIVTAKTSTTLTIDPGIHHQPDSNLVAKVTVFQFQTNASGVENMKIIGTNGAGSSQPFAIIQMNQCYGCWVYNVETVDAFNYHIYTADCFRCEFRYNNCHDRTSDGSNGAGLLVNDTSSCLFEDNIVAREFPVVEVNQGSTGNVFGYNLFEDSRVFSTIGANIDTNHDPHNSFNLYEGNIAGNLECDGYFGSASQDTIYRNWITGTIYDQSIQSFVITLKRFTRNYTIIGNILGNSLGSTTPGDQYFFGQPNIGNSDHIGTAQPTTGDFWADWQAMKDATPPGGPGPTGFQELDLDVEPTTILKANYNLPVGSIPAGEGLGGDTLVNSLYRSSKPSFFFSLTWPPFDPLSPGTPNYDRIPAGYRFVHGVDPGGGTGKVISLSGNMAFGNVVIGNAPTSTLTVSNNGDTLLTVTSVSYPTAFTGATTGFTVAAGSSHDITVTFTPLLAQLYSGNITVSSDATSGTNTIACSGTGVVEQNQNTVYPRDKRAEVLSRRHT